MLNGLNILPSYTEYFNLNDVTTGLNTASVTIGGILGPLVSGMVADKFGRRPAILWGSIITIIGIILQTAAQNIAMFVVARILLGFGSAITGIAGSTPWPARCNWPAGSTTAPTRPAPGTPGPKAPNSSSPSPYPRWPSAGMSFAGSGTAASRATWRSP